MAVALVGTPTSAYLFGGGNLPYTTPAGLDRYAMLGISAWDSSPPALVALPTYDGVPSTLVGTTKITGNQDTVWLYGLVAPSTGLNSWTWAFVGGTADSPAGAWSFEGVNQVTPTGLYVHSEGSSANPALSVPSGVGEYVVDIMAYAAGLTSRDSGQTQLWQDQTSEAGQSSYKAGSAGSVAMNYTQSAAVNWVMGGVSIKPVAAAGPTTNPTIHLRAVA